MNLRYRVKLRAPERSELQGLLSGGQQPVRKLKRAQILLAADEGRTDEQIAGSSGAVSRSTVYRTRQVCGGQSVVGAQRAAAGGAVRELATGEVALLAATAGAAAPNGRGHAGHWN